MIFKLLDPEPDPNPDPNPNPEQIFGFGFGIIARILSDSDPDSIRNTDHKYKSVSATQRLEIRMSYLQNKPPTLQGH
jgi:hypothetical protein